MVTTKELKATDTTPLNEEQYAIRNRENDAFVYKEFIRLEHEKALERAKTLKKEGKFLSGLIKEPDLEMAEKRKHYFILFCILQFVLKHYPQKMPLYFVKNEDLLYALEKSAPYYFVYMYDHKFDIEEYYKHFSLANAPPKVHIGERVLKLIEPLKLQER